MWTYKPAVASLLLLLCVAGVGLAAEAPLAVSPGDASGLALVEGRCPTFNWGALEGARSYELVVYRLSEEGQEVPPVLRKSFAGSVYGWTPSLDRCLKRGGRYAWSVRAVGRRQESQWSQPSLFQVASGPSEAEFAEALRVVQDYLGATESAVPPDNLENDTAEKPGESSNTPRADDSAPEPKPADSTAAAAMPPAFPLTIRADQAVAYLESSSNSNGSVLELRSTVVSPSFLGAINFNTAASTFPGQIAYQGDDTMTFRTNTVERMRITSAGDVTNGLGLNGLVKAWAKIGGFGSVLACWRCNMDPAKTKRTAVGTYEVDFDPLGTDISTRPILCAARENDKNVACGTAGFASSAVFVTTRELITGGTADGSFTVFVF